MPASVGGGLTCNDNELTSLKGAPQSVGGDFWCNSNGLTSLEGAPELVGCDFVCQYNKLTSLKGAPSSVGFDFLCNSNELISLEGVSREIGEDLWCNDNRLTSLKGIQNHIKKIGGDFNCTNNPIRSHILGLMMIEIGGKIKTGLGNGTDIDEILNKWKNQGRRGVMGAMKELIDLGYEELAQL